MIVLVEAGGRTRAVEVRRGNGGFVVVIDGRERTVDVSAVNGAWSLLIGSASYEVSISDAPDGTMTVRVDGRPVPVSVASSRPAWRDRRRDPAPQGGAAGPSTALGSGPQRIAAPMPGKIVKVLVKPGERVTARQGLVIVEAMKMENELRSPKAGTISEVRVQEGASVEAGAILVIVE